MTENSKIPAASKEAKDWLGGPQNGAEATYQQNGQTAVAPAEFTAALREQRDRLRNADGGSPHATISDLLSSARTKPPEVRGRPSAALAQNSDALDDVLASVKGVAKSGFTSCVDSVRSSVLDLPNPPDRASLFRIGEKFKSDLAGQLDKAYDVAESSGQNLLPADQQGLLNFMENVVQRAAGAILNDVFDFLQGCPLEGIKQGIDQEYSKVINFINNVLQ